MLPFVLNIRDMKCTENIQQGCKNFIKWFIVTPFKSYVTIGFYKKASFYDTREKSIS